MPLDDRLKQLESQLLDQKHILQEWDTLTDSEKESLIAQINDIDFSKLKQSYELTKVSSVIEEDDLLPPSYELFGSHKDLADNPNLGTSYTETAYRAIKDGKVAVLLLAGGQGTRLGVNYPKGMFNINLPSQKSLYQLQAERLIRLCQIVKKLLGGEPVIPWYVMTSEHTQEQTECYFRKHNYFGYNPMHIIFFEQYTIPCLYLDGKVIMETPSRIAKSPDGNGGIYRTLRDKKILLDMQERGVEFVQTYCVDNVLVKMADPYFMGFCMFNGLDCAAKVVEKLIPTEPIGVLARHKNKYRVVEYSEISKETSQKLANGGVYSEETKSDERLLYHCGNICIHFMSREFLDRVSKMDIEEQLKYHVAKKKIPYFDTAERKTTTPKEINGIKLEKFIFDVFPFANKFGIWEVSREEEFAALKNPCSMKTDCPTSCRQSLLKLFREWAIKAGAKLEDSTVLEISPLVSVNGEGLESLNGKQLTGVCYMQPDQAAPGAEAKIVSVADWKDGDS